MEGKVLTVEFELNGQTFQALDGGAIFKFNEAISLLVATQDQKKRIIIGERCQQYPRPNSAAGVRTGSDFPGKLFQRG